MFLSRDPEFKLLPLEKETWVTALGKEEISSAKSWVVFVQAYFCCLTETSLN